MRALRNLLVVVVAGLLIAVAWKLTRPSPVYSDLDIFLDGGMVEVDGGSVDDWEPAWFSDRENNAVDWVLHGLNWGWGVANRQELRRRLELPLDTAGRSEAWFYGHLFDDLTAERIWKQVLERDHDDLEAALWLSEFEAEVNGPSAAIEAIAGSHGATAQHRDRRSGAGQTGGQLEGSRCATLIGAGRYEEAIASCKLATQLDGTSGRRTLALALWGKGDLAAALARAQEIRADPSRQHTPSTWSALAGVTLALGHAEEAQAIWKDAHQRFPFNVMFRGPLPPPGTTAAQWEQLEERWARIGRARRLAWCGHIYLDLDLDERSQACFAASEKLDPAPALAQRLVHQAELGAPDAAAKAEAAARANPDALLLAAAGWILENKDQPAAARRYAERALALEPDNLQAVSVMWQACGDLKDYPCLLEYRRREGLPSHLPPGEP